MESIRVLFVSQEITPYLPETEMSLIARTLPQKVQERGMEIRTFMPRYGLINERRNQLHEVIRLSGMNLIINDTDHPLIIKVASIQSARMQVYFIDNEDYFQRKFVFTDEKGEEFADNDERAIFFARGVIETVRKLRWAPDIVHCHGWFTSFIPLYLKKVYFDDPLFVQSRVVYSFYNDAFEKPLSRNLKQKLVMEGVHARDIEMLDNPSYQNVMQMVAKMSDGLVLGSREVDSGVLEMVSRLKKPLLRHFEDGEEYVDLYTAFYDKILAANKVLHT
jgi:starch synthase